MERLDVPKSTGQDSHSWVFNHLFPFSKIQLSIMMIKSFLFSGWHMVKEMVAEEFKSKLNNVLCCLFCLRSLIY